jgi:hypothetical protein
MLMAGATVRPLMPVAVETYMLPMRDGVRLATDVYLPRSAPPYPVILIRWSPRNLATELTARLAPAGDGTAVTLELQLNRTGHTIYGAELYLHAWELKEAETYLRGEPVGFAAMEHFDRRTLERVYLSMGLGVAIAIPIVVLIVVIGRPILSDLGIDRPLRGAILGGLSGAIAGSLVWLFIRVLLNPQKY